jgi:acetolactate synthase I/II/III large subunit
MKVADFLVARLAAAGARAIFGMPGGGSNLDIIDAGRRRGLPFVLSHTETAGVIMAAAQAEITGAPGVCLSTLGPGVSSIVNGVAHAWLDRVPLVVLTDVMDPAARVRYAHQNLPHAALMQPITTFTSELTAIGADALLDAALARALGDPPGPVHLDCAPHTMTLDTEPGPPWTDVNASAPSMSLTATAKRLLGQARRPLVIAGLGARRRDEVAALRTVCARRTLPALLTYKAKGVIADADASYAGLFTLGEIERPLVEHADLLLTVGLDPVELLPRPWPWAHPIVHCARARPAHDHMPPGESIIGDLAAILREVDDSLPLSSEWTVEQIAAHRDRQRAAVMSDTGGFTPGQALAAVAEGAAAARHVTVDAGAHMFPAMALVPAAAPGRILISNGLSTMGYALPAAIGAALVARHDPVVAITGDAGLLLCLSELRTAAREGVRVVVVVLADGELSLIRIKQDRRGLDSNGVRIGAMDWVSAARGLGLQACRARDGSTLRQHLAEALAARGPTLIEAQIDPGGYGRMLQALRG